MARTAPLARLDRRALEWPTADPLILRELPFRARLLVRGPEAELAVAAAAAGLALPERVGGRTASGTRRALRLGPDRLVVLDEPGSETALAAALDAALADRPAAWVDLTEAMTTLRLEGPDAAARATLAEGCPLDLHPSVFPTGTAAASLYGRIPVWLEAIEGDGGRLVVELQVDRSLAEHTLRHLALAGREHGLVLPD